MLIGFMIRARIIRHFESYGINGKASIFGVRHKLWRSDFGIIDP